MSTGAPKRWALWLALSVAAPASADEGAYLLVIGAGASLRSISPFTPQGSILVKSVFGVTDQWNWEAPVWIDFRGGRVELTIGGGAEYVFLRAGRLRWSLEGGGFAEIPIVPRKAVGLGPYLGTATRWKVIWGFGAGLELHGGYRWSVDGSGHGAFGSAVMTVFSEL